MVLGELLVVGTAICTTTLFRVFRSIDKTAAAQRLPVQATDRGQRTAAKPRRAAAARIPEAWLLGVDGALACIQNPKP